MTDTSDEVRFTSLAARPDLSATLQNFVDPTIARFLYRDAVDEALWWDLVTRFPEYTLLALDPAETEPVGVIYTLPFTGDPDRLPDHGYDAVLLAAAADVVAGRRGNLVSAILASVRPGHRRKGLSAELVVEARRAVARLGHDALLAPVRPTHKHDHPHVPMMEYLSWLRADGLSTDPWLRVHQRLGGQVVGVCHRAMTISGTLEEWRDWTGLPFDTSGPVVVSGGLVAVWCDLVHGVAIYVEPNVWVRHPA